MTTDIRPAVADDAAFLARIAYIAARGGRDWGFYDVMIPMPEPDVVRRLAAMTTTSVPSFHHHSNRLVATIDGVPAASISTYASGSASGAALGMAMMEVFSGEQLVDLIKRRGPIDTCLVPPAEGTWVIELVGTLPEYRRRGLVRALLAEGLANGHRQGHTVAGVTVEIGNEAAIGAYEDAGFEIADERRHPNFERAMRIPGLYYMERAL